MKLKNFLTILLLCSFLKNYSQKVGLVLSGGGAKGITHIGIIKALEENNIPIDYIAGTSMGGIIGGLYAMGYTPDEMIKTLKSNEFRYWSTGEVETNYKFFYRRDDPKPSFIDIPFNISNIDSISLKTYVLPTNLVSPRQMNYAFLPLCSQANALAGGDFDKLFVPYRCVASDIYNKETIVFKNGDLGSAIRASMTFPFVFKPLNINGRLLFDGGIFNNFPVDVMRNDFNPEFTIGSVVSNNPSKPDERDIVMQIQNMIMNKTDYSLSKKEGLLLKFDLNNIKTFDFTKVDQLVKIGYDSTMKHMDEIKARIQRRMASDDLAEKRNYFQAQFPDLRFQNIIVEGVDSLQENYVKQSFHNRNKIFTLKDLKTAYFKLISDEKILEVMPNAVYNSSSGLFDLHLNVKTQNHLKVQLGGNISSSTSNQAFMGLTYQNLTDFAQSANIDAQFGKVYNGLCLGTRIEIPAQKSWYVKMALVFHKFDFYEGNKLFYLDNRNSNFSQKEVYGKISTGFPFTMKGRIEIGVGYGITSDNYLSKRDISTTINNEDISKFTIGSAFAKIECNTLDNFMYSTKGYNYSGALSAFKSKESYTSILTPANNVRNIDDYWLQAKAKIENYFNFSSKFTLGSHLEIALSNRSLLNNYIVNIIQAPSFHPTPHSRTVFNKSFSANNFAAIGLKPIYHFTNDFQLRNETYWFMPYKNILADANMKAYYSEPYTTSYAMVESSLVYNFKLVSAAMFVNYYSSGESKWNFGVNIGFLLFNPKFTD